MKRSGTKIVGGIRVCAGSDQQISNSEIIEVRGPMQRGGPIALRRIHINMLLSNTRTEASSCVFTA